MTRYLLYFVSAVLISVVSGSITPGLIFSGLTFPGSVLSGSITLAADFEGDASAGQAKAAVCVACHGADGNSLIPANPSLAGQHSRYTIERLKDMKTDPSSYPVMSTFASTLSDQDMADIAAHFESQTIKPGAADPTLVEQGAVIYRLGKEPTNEDSSRVASCAACHGPKGEGNPLAMIPALAGQRAEYVYNQLVKFADGRREAGYQRMMHGVAIEMNTEQMKAVASYIEGLH